MQTYRKEGWRTTKAVEDAGVRGYYPRSLAILAVAWLVYFVDVFMRYNIPTVMPVLREQYNWSATTVGWVDSAYLWAYALTQVPWGYISERWLGARWTVTIGTAMIAVASVVFAWHVESLSVGIAARAMIGAGAAAIWVPLNPALARWFAPHRRGMQNGVLGTGGTAGTLAGGALMPVLVTGSAAIFGLTAIQTGFLWSALPGLIMVFIVPFIIRDRPEEIGLRSLDATAASPKAEPAGDKEPTFGYIMTHSGYPYLLAIVYAGYLGALYFVWTWFAAYLNAAYGIDVRSAGLLWALAATLPAFISQPVSGYLSDQIGHVRAAAGALLMTALASMGFVVLAALGNVVPWQLVIGLALVFSFFVNMWVLVWPFTTMMFPTSAGGPIGGFMNTFAQLVGAAAPVVSGYFIDKTGSYVMVFVIGAACAFIGFVSSLFLKERRVI
jgi:sugar phosphate permease